MSYANITDVSTRLGRPITSADEIAQVNVWILDVEALIMSRIPTLAAMVLAGSPSSAIVVMVEANAVIRKIRNPEGKVSEDIDDYRYRLNADAARGDIFLTDDEWAQLTPDSTSQGFTIRPYSAPGYSTDTTLVWS